MYGAYECPHCVEANEIVREIESREGERLRFVFRHFPGTNVYPHAEAAAEVAEAAGEQGKFWEMHDTLFAHFNHLDGEHLVLYAKELELDMERFEQAINHRSFAARVQEDFKSGERRGVRSASSQIMIVSPMLPQIGRELNVPEAVQGTRGAAVRHFTSRAIRKDQVV
jgi:protein-disulfide isomerase